MDTRIKQSWKTFLIPIATLIGLCNMPSGYAANITVSGLTDAVGSCAAGDPVVCPSLRAAVIYANGTAGVADTITLGANAYVLSIDGVDETWTGTGTDVDPYVADTTPNAAIGDLDLTDSITINGTLSGIGSDQLATTIRWDAKSITDPTVGDRIFHIQGIVGGAAVTVTLSNLILRDGSVGVTPNTDCAVTTNPYDIEIIPGDLCEIWQFRRMGGAISIGPGASVVLYEAAIHGPDADDGGGGGMPVGPFPGGKPGDEETEAGVIESVTLNKVAIIGNQSGADAGGIYNAGPTTINQSVLSGNTGGTNGGGIYNDAAMTINETTMGTATAIPFLADAIAADATLDLSTGNSAEGGGGLFDTGVHTTTINESAIVGNSATGGAGIGARSLVVIDITNTTISGNSAFDVGGGITTNGTVNLKSSTVAFNDSASDAPGGGGGLNSFGQGTYNLLNTIVSNNVRNSLDSNCGCSGGAATCAPGRIVSLGHNLENANTCELGLSSDIKSTDPELETLAMNGGLTETHALPHTQNGDSVDSPAVDKGDNNECPNNDQRGSLRPFDGNLDFSTNCDIGAFELFIPTNDLHIENMSAPDKVNKGDGVTVTLEIHNPTGTVSGIANVDATNVVLTAVVDADLSGAAASFIKTGGADTACTVAGTKITCAIGALPLDNTVTVTLTATAGVTGTVDVSAAVTADTKDLLPGNNIDSVHITVIGYSDMQVSGSAAATSVDLGDPLSATYTVTNAAGGDAASNVRLGVAYSDNVTFDSTTTSGVTCVANDGEVSCDIGDLAAAASTSVTLVFDTVTAGDTALAATVVADQNDTDTSNNSNDLSVTVIANSDLAVTLAINDSSVTKGKNVTATLTVTNSGPDAATNVVLNVTLPTGWTVLTASAGTGTCTPSGTTIGCTWATLSSSGVDTVTITASADAKGTSSITASVTADQNDTDASNNSVSTVTKVKKKEDEKNAFGCSATSDAAIDPTLPFVLLLSLAGLYTRRLRQERRLG